MSDITATQCEKVLPLSRGRTKGYPQVTATTATVLPWANMGIYLGLCHLLPHHCHCQPLPTATATPLGGVAVWQYRRHDTKSQPSRAPRKATA